MRQATGDLHHTVLVYDSDVVAINGWACHTGWPVDVEMPMLNGLHDKRLALSNGVRQVEGNVGVGMMRDDEQHAGVVGARDQPDLERFMGEGAGL